MVKKKEKGKIIAIGARLECFVDLVDPNASDPVEEMEEDMSTLAVGFAAQMRKRVTSAQRETTPGSELSGGKRPKWFSPNEEAHKSPTVVTMDSVE